MWSNDLFFCKVHNVFMQIVKLCSNCWLFFDWPSTRNCLASYIVTVEKLEVSCKWIQFFPLPVCCLVKCIDLQFTVWTLGRLKCITCLRLLHFRKDFLRFQFCRKFTTEPSWSFMFALWTVLFSALSSLLPLCFLLQETLFYFRCILWWMLQNLPSFCVIRNHCAFIRMHFGTFFQGIVVVGWRIVMVEDLIVFTEGFVL